MKTKFVFLCSFLIFGLFMSCNNDDDTTEPQFESTAKIYELDLTLCACCGGQIIEIDGDLWGTRRFSELPDGIDIDLDNGPFPINIRLNWEASESFCGNGITIESMEVID